MDFNQKVVDAVRYAGEMNEGKATAFLLHYLFTYKQVTQKISELSGGERSRLQLALLVLSGANFLLLDEPTNNLDIASAEVLEQALEEFEGTVLVISHDRYFLDRTVERLLCIENGQLVEYQGGYSDYLVQRLHDWGVRRVYGYPGDGINGVMGALIRSHSRRGPAILRRRRRGRVCRRSGSAGRTARSADRWRCEGRPPASASGQAKSG